VYLPFVIGSGPVDRDPRVAIVSRLGSNMRRLDLILRLRIDYTPLVEAFCIRDLNQYTNQPAVLGKRGLSLLKFYSFALVFSRN
jgi:hypothetical protein